MADNDDPAEAALRLEAALERIAQRAHRVGAQASPSESLPFDSGHISARLDALIAHLRDALRESGH